MAGDRDPRFGAAAQAMGIERLERGRLDDDHVQRTALHGRLLQAERREQLGSPATSAEHDALGADLATIDAQPDQLVVVEQRFDPLAGQQAVTSQLGQPGDQAGHVQHQLAEPIDLALEPWMLQRRRQLIALDLADPRAHCLAGEEAGEVAGQGAWRPQIVCIGQQAHAAKVQLALAFERFAPAPRHIGDRLGGTGERTAQRVLGAAMDDALGLHALPAAQCSLVDQQGGKTQSAQARVQPKAGDAAANDQDVGAEGFGHVQTSLGKRSRSITAVRRQLSGLRCGRTTG